MFPLKLIDKFKFYLERQLAKGALYQLITVWCLVGVLSLIAGVLIGAIHGPGESYGESIWWAFLRLSDPGYLGDDEGFWRRLVSTVLTVMGYVLFMGTLVAIMTQWLFGRMRTLERGLTPVALRQHFTILGWNSRTIPILLDILGRGPLSSESSTKRARSKLAVLADDITDGASAQFYAHRELAAKRRQVVLRSGSMLNPQHLHRVAAAQAKVVIIPAQMSGPERASSADAEAIKVLLSLNAQCPHDKLPLAIVEMQSAENIALARHSYRGPLHLVASDVAIARAFNQSVLNPGIAEVLDYLLVDANGCQLYLTPATHLHGRNWRDIGKHYQAAIPCGIVRRCNGRSEPMLAPDDELLIGRDDALILLANRERDILYLEQAEIDTRQLPKTDSSLSLATQQPKHVLILGWNARAPKFIEQLQQALGNDVAVTSISTTPTQERAQHFDGKTRQPEFVEADYTRPKVLKAQSITHYDSIVVFASDRLERGEEADARSIVTNQLLDYLLEDEPRRPQVVVELIDPNNTAYVSVSQHKLRSEVVQSSAMISHLLAQLAIYPELRLVYDSLLNPTGVGIHLRSLPQSWFGQWSFRQLQHAVAEQGAVLLGIKQGTERTELNLNPVNRVVCNEDTLLIVIGR